MAQYNHLPIFQLAYKLTLEIYQTTHQFSREYKYTLGQKLKEISAEFLDFIVVANSQKNKLSALKEARLRLERLRIHIRQRENYPESIINEKFLNEKVKYIYNNPVKKEYVTKQEERLYSSARNRILNDNIIMKLDNLIE